MDCVKEWSLIICFASIVSTMIELICPNGNMGKMVRFVLGLFMICAIITPIFGISKNKINFDVKQRNFSLENSKFKEDINSQIIDVSSEKIKKLVFKELKEKEIFPDRVDVNIDVDDKNSISSIKMKIWANDICFDKNKTKDILKEKLGITEVEFGSG